MTARQGGAAIPWRSFTSPSQVRAAVTERIGDSATPAQVEEFLALQGLEHSDPVDGVVYASAPARSSLPLARAKWLLVFRFDSGRLAGLDVEIGHTGP